jgi:hypothetical protein
VQPLGQGPHLGGRGRQAVDQQNTKRTSREIERSAFQVGVVYLHQGRAYKTNDRLPG